VGRSSAQARLGHADAATTLREYAHALPLTDHPVADAINTHLDTVIEPGKPSTGTVNPLDVEKRLIAP